MAAARREERLAKSITREVGWKERAKEPIERWLGQVRATRLANGFEAYIPGRDEVGVDH